MILEITFLLLLILIEAPLVGEDRQCECDCSCGRKHQLPATYINHSEEHDKTKLNDGIVVEEGEDGGENDHEALLVGGEGGDDSWNSSTANSALIPYRGLPLNPTFHTYRDRDRSINQNSRKHYSNRPKPPHLDRSVPDRRSTFLSSNSTNKKKKDDYRCSHCHRSFCDLVAIQQHNFAVHPTTTTMSSVPKKSHNQSIRSISPETDSTMIICEVCLAEFPTTYLLDEHKTIEHSWAIFCSPCLLRFDHAQDAQDHYQLHHFAEPMNPRRVQKMLDAIKGPSASVGNSTLINRPMNTDISTLTPFIPSHQPYQAQDHFVRTFPSHTVQTYYECNECSVVFAHPMELESHQAAPEIHGGRIYEADDFPPLGQSNKPSETSRIGADELVEENRNAWGMPSFTLDRKKSEEICEKEWVPQARLSPEPPEFVVNSKEEVGGKGCLEDGFLAEEQDTKGGVTIEEIVQDEVIITDELPEEGSSYEPPSRSGNDQIFGDIEVILDKGHQINMIAEVNESSDSKELTSAQDQARPMRSITLDEVRPTSPVLILEDEDIDAPATQTESLSEVIAARNLVTTHKIAPLEKITPRPIIQPVPSHISLTPYAKAALASASRLGEYPPPETSNDEHEIHEGDAQKDQPSIIGGIECHVPSFFMPTSSNKKAAPVTSPLSLDSIPTPPLTLNSSSDSSSSLNDSLVLDEGNYASVQETWEDPEEVYEITYSQPRPIFSLDLGAPINGNRPRPKTNTYSNSMSGSSSSSGSGSGSKSRSRSSKQPRFKWDDRRKERETFLTPSQKDTYSNENGRKGSKKEVKPALQPMFESEWSTLDSSSTINNSTGGRGGMVTKESAWDISMRQAEERNRAVHAHAGGDDAYGGW